jgi:aminoglycoside phosphotransferase (APT) family kinase protein
VLGARPRRDHATRGSIFAVDSLSASQTGDQPPGFGLVPLEGGYSGETFLAEAAGERTVVRIYGSRSAARRGAGAAEVDAAVLRLVRGLLPVPEVLEARRQDESAGTPGLLVTTFLPGTRLDLVLPELEAGQRATVGRHVGVILARLAMMPLLRPGFFLDGDLRTEPMPAGGLVAFVEAYRRGTAISQWPAGEYDALLEVADRAEILLDTLTRSCLVHSDFNPKNLLVDVTTLEVTGVLDWEFAHSGWPVTDLGNLLRFERDPVFAGAVLEAHREGVVDAAEDLLDLARAAAREPGHASRVRAARRHRAQRRPARRTVAAAVGRARGSLRILRDAQESA